MKREKINNWDNKSKPPENEINHFQKIRKEIDNFMSELSKLSEKEVRHIISYCLYARSPPKRYKKTEKSKKLNRGGGNYE